MADTLLPSAPWARGSVAARRLFAGLLGGAAVAWGLTAATAVAASPPRPVTGATAEASSQAGPDTGPAHVLDGIDFRPWVSAPWERGRVAPSTSARPWLRITLPRPVLLRRLVILPGHSGSVARFREHARPTAVRLRFDAGTQDVVLPDRLGPVSVTLAPRARTRTITLEITATAGPVGRGVAISAVRLFSSREAAAVAPAVAAQIEAQIAVLEDPAARPEAVAALRGLGAAASPWLLAAVARGGDGGAAALQVLASTDGEEARRLVRTLLTSGDPTSVARASSALKASALPGLERPALRALAAAPEPARRALLSYLVQRAVPEALPALEASMRRGRAWAVILAGEHLGAYGLEGRAVATRWAGDADEALRIAGTAALRSLWPDRGRADPLNAPGAGGTAAADRQAFLASLIKLARGPVQAAAMDSLVALGAPAADTLRETLSGASPETRHALLQRLGDSSVPQGVSLLVELVLRGDSTAAWYADGVEALAARGAVGARQVLARLEARPEAARCVPCQGKRERRR